MRTGDIWNERNLQSLLHSCGRDKHIRTQALEGGRAGGKEGEPGSHCRGKDTPSTLPPHLHPQGMSLEPQEDRVLAPEPVHSMPMIGAPTTSTISTASDWFVSNTGLWKHQLGSLRFRASQSLASVLHWLRRRRKSSLESDKALPFCSIPNTGSQQGFPYCG